MFLSAVVNDFAIFPGSKFGLSCKLSITITFFSAMVVFFDAVEALDVKSTDNVKNRV